MFRNAWLKPVVVSLAALAAVLSLPCPRAEAQVKPFKVVGEGVADYIPFQLNDPVFHFAVGVGTDLGKYYGEGKVVLDRFTSATTAEFSSAVPFVFVAANGDRLACHYGRTDFGAAQPGKVQLYPAGGG